MSAGDTAAAVSVVIPTYRRRPLLLQAIRSALEQTAPPREVLVVDDASDDGTAEAVRALGEPVRLLAQEQRGVAAARNVGVGAATGSLIAFLDSDDLWHPEKLALQLPLLAAAPEAPFSFTDATILDASGIVAESMMGEAGRARALRGDLSDLVFGGNYVFTSTVVARREALARVALFDPGLPGSEDYDLWIRLAMLGRPHYVDRALASYRAHDVKLSRLPDRLCVGEVAVLEKMARLHPELVARRRARFRRRVADVWFRFGCDDLRAGDPGAARAKFRAAWRADPSHGRAAAYAAATLLGPALLRALRRRAADRAT